ncbi:MAG: glycosyl hydrolase family 18 protein [Ilumatobacteraceae bacterium]
MASRTRQALVVVAALLLSACQPGRPLSGWLPSAVSPSAAATATAAAQPSLLTAPGHFVSGWVPYWGTASSRTAIENNAAAVGDVSPLFYGTTNDGNVTLLGTQQNLTAVVNSTRAAGLPLIVGVFDSTGAGIMRDLLADPTTRTAHVQHLVDLAVSKNYDGIDLDYEVFAFSHPRSEWPAITVNWVAFVNELSAALHAKGKLLSVTVPPVWSGGSSGYTVYAQGQIAAAVDRLRLMVYDYSVSSPGPISPMWWVNEVIAYSSSVVPASKLQLGVPAYGRHWVTRKNLNETCPDGAIFKESVLMKNIASVAGGRTLERHSSGELTVTWTQTVTGPRTKPSPAPVYPPATNTIPQVAGPSDGQFQPAMRLSPPSNQVTCTVQHTMFVPDAFSVDQRSDAAQAAGWRGIILWAFGYESADLFPTLAA